MNQYIYEEAEESHDKRLSGQPMSKPRFEPHISLYQPAQSLSLRTASVLVFIDTIGCAAALLISAML